MEGREPQPVARGSYRRRLFVRRIAAVTALGIGIVVGFAPAAGATHTGCAHRTTTKAHATVPHRNHGTHQAHSSIPYCPPEDAPRR